MGYLNELSFKVSLEYTEIERIRRVLEDAQREIARLRAEVDALKRSAPPAYELPAGAVWRTT